MKITNLEVAGFLSGLQNDLNLLITAKKKHRKAVVKRIQPNIDKIINILRIQK